MIPDGDGFTNKRESELGQDPLIVDVMEAGGIAGRMSNRFTYADTSMRTGHDQERPDGFSHRITIIGDQQHGDHRSPCNGATNGSNFAYWSINGVRQASPTGVASSKVA